MIEQAGKVLNKKKCREWARFVARNNKIVVWDDLQVDEIKAPYFDEWFFPQDANASILTTLPSVGWHDDALFPGMFRLVPLQLAGESWLEVESFDPVKLELGWLYIFNQNKEHRLVCRRPGLPYSLFASWTVDHGDEW